MAKPAKEEWDNPEMAALKELESEAREIYANSPNFSRRSCGAEFR